MKKLKSKKVFAALIAVILCIGIVYYLSGYKNAVCSETLSSYLSKNSYNLEDADKEKAYKLLKQAMKKNNIIFNLLDYNVEENYKINLDILKYLNKNCGIKNYICDLQYGESVVINEYLNTGNEDILKELFNKNSFSSNFNGSFTEYLKSLYQYNKNLKDNEKIKVYGVYPDIEFESSVLAFKYLLPKNNAPHEISTYINAFKNNLNNITDNSTYVDFGLKFEDNFKQNLAIYKSYLGGNFFDFKIICDNIIDTAKYIQSHPTWNDLNNYVITEVQKNFNLIYSQNKDKKYYGVFNPEYCYNSNRAFTIYSVLGNKNANIKNNYIITRYYDNKLAPSKSIDNSSIKYNKTLIENNKSTLPLSKEQCNYIVYVKNAAPAIAEGMTANERKKICDYLNNNKITLGDNKNITLDNAQLLANYISKYDIYFTGEAHAIKINPNIELSFLKYLNKNAGVKYFLCEMGYAQGQLINEFLKTGDKSILKNILTSLYNTAACNNQTVEKWIDLYEYNKTLPEDKKIVVVGIDIEHQEELALEYLKSLIPNTNPPTEISQYIAQLKAANLKNTDLFQRLKESINKTSALYKKYFGDRYFDFKLVTENIINALNYYGNNQDSTLREKAIYSNFVQVYSHLPKGKYYGQWGSAHIDLSYRDKGKDINGETMATMINEKNSPLHGKVLSIPINYINCSCLNNNIILKTSPSYNMSTYFNLLADNEVTLFKLDGEASPFKERNYVVPNTSKGVTTDYLQYILLVKNSPAADKYTGIK